VPLASFLTESLSISLFQIGRTPPLERHHQRIFAHLSVSVVAILPWDFLSMRRGEGVGDCSVRRVAGIRRMFIVGVDRIAGIRYWEVG
jgi:hypothetical protein